MRIPDLIPAGWDCPHCGEPNELSVDPTAGEKQEFVEDCTACCRPSVIVILLDRGRIVSLTAEPES